MADFPTLTGWKEFNVTSEHRVISNDESVSWKKQVTLGDDERLIITADTGAITRDKAREIEAFLKEIRGYGTFQLDVEHGITKYNGNLDLSIENSYFSVSSAVAAGQSQIPISTVVREVPQAGTIHTESLPGHSYLQFATGGKIYQIVDRVDNTLTVLPSLYEPIVGGTEIHVGQKKGTFRIKDGKPDIRMQGVHHSSYRFTFIEEIQ